MSLYRIFNVYRGEGVQAFLFALLAYVWALSVFTGYKYSDALFLHNVGPESLPQAYMLTAGVLLAFSILILYAIRSQSPDRIFFFTLFCFALFYFFCFTVQFRTGSHHGPTFWFTLKVIAYSMYIIMNTCFWMFVDQYYHIQDAKRLFTLFATAIFLGDITTGLFMQSGALSLSILFIAISILSLLAIILGLFISKKFSPAFDDMGVEYDAKSEHQTFQSLIKAIFTSKFTLLLLLFNFFMQLQEVVTEFNYYTAFTEYFGSTSAGKGMDAELTRFLGKCVAGVGIFKLIVGLFIYSRLTRKLGINNLVMVTPLLLIFSYIGWMSSTLLLFPLMGFLAVEGTTYVFDDNNFSLLLSGVPSRVKYKVRIFIESFFEPIAMLSSSLLLTFSISFSKTVGFIISLSWLAVAFSLKNHYLEALLTNLWNHTLHIGRTAKQWYATMRPKEKKKTEHRLLAIFRYGDERAEEFAIDGILAFENLASLPKLLKQLDEAPLKTKFYFIDAVSSSPFAEEKIVTEHLEMWQKEKESSLTQKIRFFFATHGKEKIDEKSFELLNSEKLGGICLRLNILSCNSTPENVDQVMKFLGDENVQVFRTASKVLSKIIDRHSSHYSATIIDELAKSKDYQFRLNCLDALAKIINPIDVPAVISATSHFRARERRKIEEMIFILGKKSVLQLLSLLSDQTLHYRSRILAGRIVGQLDLSTLHNNLFTIVESELERVYFYLHHSRIQNHYPNKDLSLLTRTLQSGFHSSFDFIIELLGVAGSIKDSDLISRSLKSRSPKMRAAAVEALEKSCSTKIFKLIIPLIEEHTFTSFSALLSLNELLDKLDKSPFRADKITALTMKYQLNISGWKESLKRYEGSQDELLKTFIVELLNEEVEPNR